MIDFHKVGLYVDEEGISERVMIRINSKRRFPCANSINLTVDELNPVFEFAYAMAFGDKHREHRSGGTHSRKAGEIFADTFQGKVAECAACKLFQSIDSSVKPDFAVYERNFWDSVDLVVNGKSISIKSTTSFGQLLLLECRDWADDGSYIPNSEVEKCCYDYTVLCRVSPQCSKILRNARMYYSTAIKKEVLREIVLDKNPLWQCDIAGYITLSDLVDIISKKEIIRRGYYFNSFVKVDADNYYVQAGDMRTIDSLLDELKQDK